MASRDHRPAQQQLGSVESTAAVRSRRAVADSSSDRDDDDDDDDDEPWGLALRNLRVQHASENQSSDERTVLAPPHDPAAAMAHITLEHAEQEQGTVVFGAAAASVSKSSLSFILDDDDDDNQSHAYSPSPAPSSVVSDSDYEHRSESGQEMKSESVGDSARIVGAARSLHSKLQSTSTSRRSKQGEPKRKARRPPSRICKFEDCEQYVVDQGLCVRHGGGKRCQTDGCTSRAKHQGRCWRHGGSTECKVPTCINRAKSRGYCWSHGGGTKCKVASCGKIAISNGLCWAHGGGKRCIVRGCLRQAYERTNNFCNNHFQGLESGTFAGEVVDEDADEAMDGGTGLQQHDDVEEEVKRAS